MKNGFRKKAVGSKGDAIQEMQTRVANVEMALRISQMLNKQLLEQVQRLDRDVHNSVSVTNDLEYRSRAIIEVADLNSSALDSAADRMKLADYNKASDSEDLKNNYTVGDIITEDSIVIISSETEDGEGSIFRSKFKLSEAGVPALTEALKGKAQGDKAEVSLNNKKHIVTIEGIRIAPLQPKEEQSSVEQQLQ